MGGDLNMKKHFHPLTMENLERVWKAEEKKRKEEEQCLQLQQELAEERQREQLQRQAVESGLIKKKSEKLDWMYSGQQAVNTEEYLLGKKIDKHVEVMKDEDEEKNIIEGNIHKKPVLNPKASDILAKVKEDPLFLIKKREEENRKELVQNPIKMRKLKALLQSQAKEKKKKSKKERKEKKKRDSKSLRYADEREKDILKNKFHDSKFGSRYDKKHNSHNYNWNEQQTNDTLQRNSNQEYRRETYKNETYNFHDRDDKKVHKRRIIKEDSSNRDYRNSKTEIKSRRERSLSSSSSDDREMEERRKAMMENAQWRKEQRIKNLRSHEEETLKEEEKMKSVLSKTNVTEDKARFIQKLQVASYSSDATASVEDRIKRNIHSKQRTKADLEKKFTAR